MNEVDASRIALNNFERMMKDVKNIDDGFDVSAVMLTLCSKFMHAKKGIKFKEDFLRSAIKDDDILDIEKIESFFFKKH